MLTSRRLGGRAVTSSPSMTTRPSSGVSKPPRMRSVVDLPQPEGPRKVMNSPARMRMSRSSMAVTAPKRLVMRSR